MKITVIGTGMVGRTLAAAFAAHGHEVAIGTRDPGATLARTEPDGMGTPPYAAWAAEHEDIALLPAPEAASRAELVVNASAGRYALEALRGAGAENLEGKILLDVALPLDLSAGMPPTLTVANTDSLGERTQREFPGARVVKSLTSVFCAVMVDPARVEGEHDLFIAGDDEQAKSTVAALISEFGWDRAAIIDLGDISGARAMEMYSRLFFTLAGRLGTFEFNIQLHRAAGEGD